MGYNQMNPDYYSDVKLAERFFFENSIYLLNMFEKKVDSFTSNKTLQSRQRDRNELTHPLHIISLDTRNDDPIRALSKDLTKPIWNCVTKTEPVVLCLRNTTEHSTIVNAINQYFARFLLRLKHEHEDESNFRILLHTLDRHNAIEELVNRGGDERVWPRMQELLLLLGRVREKYERDLRERNEQNEFLEDFLQWSKSILNSMAVEEGNEEAGEEVRLPAELYSFVSAAVKNMEEVIESAQGPTVLNYWPDLSYLPELVHPLLIAAYVIVRGQMVTDRNRTGTHIPNQPNQGGIEEESGCVFEELPERNFSKITFINLDGYDSPFNLTLAKSISRYLQYIAFPCEEDHALSTLPAATAHYFQNYSEFLVKHYVFSSLTEEQRQLQHRIFKTKNRTDKQLLEYYRQLLVFPVHSRFLSAQHDLRSAEFYQSKFIKFVMKELVYIQVREFNPSLIVLSLSNRLHLDHDFFEEMLKELTVIGNMRLLLYNNLSRSYIYDAPLPRRLLPAPRAYERHREYARAFDRRSCLFTENDVNLTILHRTAVFLKISSGTYTLDRVLEEDNVSEKYEIYRVQKYAGTLIKLIGKGHPVLERFRNRCNEYLRLERMLTSIYEGERAAEDAPAAFPLYHRQLLHLTRNLLDCIAKGEMPPGTPFLRQFSKEYLQAEWEDFVLRYRLAVKKEREEEDYKFITRLRRPRQEGEEPSPDFIALEFEITRGGLNYLVSIGKQSQVCVESGRQDRPTLVYLFNHLLDHKEPVLRSYCGEVTAAVEASWEGKVRLTQLQLPWQPQHPFQSLTKFNYAETNEVVLLFWPTVYDQAQALASRFLHVDYQPPATSLIFAARRSTPHLFEQVTPANESYGTVLPRCGCTCYHVPSTDLIYIFGGFYSAADDYLSFQTDISVARLGQQLQLWNVPKSFYFDYEPTLPQQTDLPYRITALAHDFVRPRVEYEVYPLDKGEDLEGSQIMLVGGVGEKFLRPYSLIGYMAHRLSFGRDGSLLAVRRLRLNNLVPANLRRPLRARAAAELPAVCGAQNRQIYCRSVGVPAGTAVYSWFELRFVREEEKMTYRHPPTADLALLPDSRDDRPDNTVTIRENNSQVTARALLRHYSSLKEVDNKLSLVYQYGGPNVEQSGSVIFSVELELAPDVYLRFVNLSSPEVPLTGSHLLAVDTLGLEVFAVIRHEEYTGGRCVLAHCDIAATVQGLVEGQDRRIVVREVYRFDGDMRHCTVKALPDRRVALVHGFPMHPGATIPECLLKRTARGHYVREQILNDFPSYTLNAFLGEAVYHNVPISFFFTARQSVVSWSFRSCGRGMGEEEYYFMVEELSCREEVKRWRVKTQKVVRFQKMFVTSQEPAAWVTTILDIRVTAEKKHELFLADGDRIYSGIFDAHLENSSGNLVLRDWGKPAEEYEIEKFRQNYNVDCLQKLTKYPNRYQDAQEEMDAERLH